MGALAGEVKETRIDGVVDGMFVSLMSLGGYEGVDEGLWLGWKHVSERYGTCGPYSKGIWNRKIMCYRFEVRYYCILNW